MSGQIDPAAVFAAEDRLTPQERRAYGDGWSDYLRAGRSKDEARAAWLRSNVPHVCAIVGLASATSTTPATTPAPQAKATTPKVVEKAPAPPMSTPSEDLHLTNPLISQHQGPGLSARTHS